MSDGRDEKDTDSLRRLVSAARQEADQAAPNVPESSLISAPSEFLNRARQSNLIDEAQWQSLNADLESSESPDNATAFASTLVQRKLLTSWQARQLLAGRTAFHLGRYQLLLPLGVGGMGAVFKARQPPLGRVVALKVMSAKLLSNDNAVRRFRREIRAAAALDHPNIVRALDADSAQQTHFLVMEFVEGEDLGALLKRRGTLPVGEACEYIRQTATGLQHAHERGMVHRDIKPGNLLLQQATGDSQPLVIKILDFGLAKLESEASHSLALTATGQMIGTVDYVSPEQAQESRTADIRSDIYSLGATLFRLISGSVPFDEGSVMDRLLARTRHAAPLLRSRRFDVPEELEGIVARMLATSPEERYQSPGEVALALQPFADADAIENHQPESTAGFSLGDALFDAGEMAISVFNSTGGDGTGYERFLQALATEAKTENAGVEVAGSTEATQPTNADEDRDVNSQPRSRSKLVRDLEQRKRTDRRRQFVIVSMLAALIVVFTGLFFWHKTGETTLIIDWPIEERDGGTLTVDGREQDLSESANLVIPGRPGTQSIRLTRTGYEPFDWTGEFDRGETQTVRPIWKPTPETTRKLEFSNLEKQINSVLSSLDPGVGAGEAARMPAVVKLRKAVLSFKRQHPETKEAVATVGLMSRLPWPIDGLTRNNLPPTDPPVDKSVPLVAVLGAKDLRLTHWGPISCVAFSPDRKMLASGSRDGTIKLWELPGGRLLRTITPNRHPIKRILFTPDGKHIVAACYYHAGVYLYDTSTGQELLRYKGHQNGSYVPDIAISPDGKMLATAGHDKTVRIWTLSNGKLIKTLMGETEFHSVDFSRDGKLLAGGDGKGSIRIWNSQTWEEARKPISIGRRIDRLQFYPDGKRLVANQRGAANPTVCDLETRKKWFSWRTITTNDLCIHPNGQILAAMGSNAVTRYKGEMLKEQKFFYRTHHGETAIAYSQDGERLAIGLSDGTIQVWNTRTHEQEEIVSSPSGSVVAMDISPDGRILATGSHGSACLWDLATGKKLRELGTVHDKWYAISDLAFSSNGSRLAMSTKGHYWYIWDLKTLNRKDPEKRAFKEQVDRLAFSSSGLIASLNRDDGSITLRNVRTGEKQPPIQPGTPVHAMAFNPNGTLLAIGTSSAGGSRIRIWDVVRKKFVETRNWSSRNDDSIGVLDFTRDGKRLISHPPLEVRNLETGFVKSFRPIASPVAISPGEDRVAGRIEFSLTNTALFLEIRGMNNVPVHRFSIGPSGGMFSRVVFTPDGRHVITGNHNGTAYVLRLRKWSPTLKK